MSERARAVSKAKEATGTSGMPFAAHEVGSHCMHHIGVLMVGMNPSLAQLGSEQEGLHCVRVLKEGKDE